MRKIWERFANWYLGGDPNCRCHKVLRTVGWGPVPLFREREKIQRLVHDIARTIR